MPSFRDMTGLLPEIVGVTTQGVMTRPGVLAVVEGLTVEQQRQKLLISGWFSLVLLGLLLLLGILIIVLLFFVWRRGLRRTQTREEEQREERAARLEESGEDPDEDLWEVSARRADAEGRRGVSSAKPVLPPGFDSEEDSDLDDDDMDEGPPDDPYGLFGGHDPIDDIDPEHDFDDEDDDDDRDPDDDDEDAFEDFGFGYSVEGGDRERVDGDDEEGADDDLGDDDFEDEVPPPGWRD